MSKKIIILVCFIACTVFTVNSCEKKKNLHIDQKTGRAKSSTNCKDKSYSNGKGYGLPVNTKDKQVIEKDCMDKMKDIQDIYNKAEKGDSKNAAISTAVEVSMMNVLKKTGCPVTEDTHKQDMLNYGKMSAFLDSAKKGQKAEIVLYQVTGSGGLIRRNYRFDGSNMYELFCSAVWNEKGAPSIASTSYTRLKSWDFTKKGWFTYEYCVPKSPEVTEVMNGNVLIRVYPLKQEYREMAEKYLYPVGYQGNNLLCSDWDADHMKNIDYTGLYSYLFKMKYNKNYEDEDNYSTEIPQKAFESLMEEFLPVTAGQLEQYAAYDNSKQVYVYAPLGCGNYTPNYFGTSFPEITDVKDNGDGTKTLTVDAVCEMEGNDAVITHKLTVSFLENGGIRFLSNEVMGDGLDKIPPYQYRISHVK